MHEIWNLLTHQLATNQFFSGAALAGALASAAYGLKKYPALLYNRLLRIVTFHVFIDELDDLHSALDLYISIHHPKELRTVEVKTYKGEIKMSHDNDYVFVKRQGRYIRVSKRRERLENASEKYSRYARSYSLSGIFAKKQIFSFLKEVIRFAETYYKELKDKERIITTYRYTSWTERWHPVTSTKFKQFEHIFLDGKEDLIADLDKFKNNEQFYADNHIPFRRGYMFFGDPGNGKSTLSAAIAGHLKSDIYIMDMADMQTSERFNRAFFTVPDDSVLVFEDIDAIYHNRNTAESSNSKVNFSSFINALSGIAQKNNIITVITTNYPELMDPALLRAGRCDYKMEVKNPTKAVVEEFLTSFYKKPVFVENYRSHPFVEIQEAAVRNIDDVEACLNILYNVVPK